MLAGGTRGTRALKHYGTGGAELPLVLDKTEGHATRIRDSLLAEPQRVRRAGICIRLGIGDCGERGRDHDDKSNGAQFTHDVALQMGLGVTTIGVRILFQSLGQSWTTGAIAPPAGSYRGMSRTI